MGGWEQGRKTVYSLAHRCRSWVKCIKRLDRWSDATDTADEQGVLLGKPDLDEYLTRWVLEITGRTAAPAPLDSEQSVSGSPGHKPGPCEAPMREGVQPPEARRWLFLLLGFLTFENMGQLWIVCRSWQDLLLHSLSGKAVSPPIALMAERRLAALGCGCALAMRQIYPNAACLGGGLRALRWGGKAAGSSLLSLDVDAWTKEGLLAALPHLSLLRFLRVFHLKDDGWTSAERIAWPTRLQEGAAALPGAVLVHLRGRAPRRLLVFMRSRADVDALQEETSGLAIRADVEELHLVDLSPVGLTSLRGLFGVGGTLRGAFLRRLLLYRTRSSDRFEGFFLAVRCALPNLEELYAAYCDSRPAEVQISELSSLLEARGPSLRRIAAANSALQGVESLGLVGPLPDLRLHLPHNYKSAHTRPEGLGSWAWTWFGAGSPLCPRKTVNTALLQRPCFLILATDTTI